MEAVRISPEVGGCNRTLDAISARPPGSRLNLPFMVKRIEYVEARNGRERRDGRRDRKDGWMAISSCGSRAVDPHCPITIPPLLVVCVGESSTQPSGVHPSSGHGAPISSVTSGRPGRWTGRTQRCRFIPKCRPGLGMAGHEGKKSAAWRAYDILARVSGGDWRAQKERKRGVARIKRFGRVPCAARGPKTPERGWGGQEMIFRRQRRLLPPLRRMEPGEKRRWREDCFSMFGRKIRD